MMPGSSPSRNDFTSVPEADEADHYAPHSSSSILGSLRTSAAGARTAASATDSAATILSGMGRPNPDQSSLDYLASRSAVASSSSSLGGNHHEDHSHRNDDDKGDHFSYPNKKRIKKEWLAFWGTKQSRIGEEYQVSNLPLSVNSSNHPIPPQQQEGQVPPQEQDYQHNPNDHNNNNHNDIHQISVPVSDEEEHIH